MAFQTEDELLKSGYEAATVFSNYGEEQSSNVFSRFGKDNMIDGIVVFTKKGRNQYSVEKERLSSFEGVAKLYVSLTMNYIKIPIADKKVVYDTLNNIIDNLSNKKDQEIIKKE